MSLFIAVCLWLAVMLPAPAAVKIQEVLVRRQGSSVNLRVSVINPAATRQGGSVIIKVYVRKSAHDEWQQVKMWNDLSSLAPGNRVSRDFFDANNALLKELAGEGAFDVRAVVTAPGVHETERVYSWKDTESGH